METPDNNTTTDGGNLVSNDGDLSTLTLEAALNIIADMRQKQAETLEKLAHSDEAAANYATECEELKTKVAAVADLQKQLSDAEEANKVAYTLLEKKNAEIKALSTPPDDPDAATGAPKFIAFLRSGVAQPWMVHGLHDTRADADDSVKGLGLTITVPVRLPE